MLLLPASSSSSSACSETVATDVDGIPESHCVKEELEREAEGACIGLQRVVASTEEAIELVETTTTTTEGISVV